jgi:signal transduction histidine kinase/ligand-binding sensor domain-containing protein/DNA-binding NarL/FixJ family response regulator
MKRLTKGISLLSCLFFSISIQALSATPPSSKPESKYTQTPNLKKIDPASTARPTLRTFTDKDGLPQNSILSMAFDKKRYLWVGTQDGPAYYNGRKWIAVKMPNRQSTNFVSFILAASDGSMWFGRDGTGLERYLNGNWINYSQDSGLPSSNVNAILETTSKDGSQIIWAGTDRGLACFQNSKWKIYGIKEGLPGEFITTLIEINSSEGKKILLAGTSNGIAKFEEGRWIEFSSDWPLQTKAINTIIESKNSEGTQTLWIGTPAGLAVFENGKFTVHNTKTGLPSDRVRALLETINPDGKRIVWAGTNGGGFARFEDNRWTVFNNSSGLPSNVINKLAQVPSAGGTSSIWIGTPGGLARMDSGKWLTIDTELGLLNNMVHGLLETRSKEGESTYWIGTYGSGISQFKEGKWFSHQLKSGLQNSIVHDLLGTTSRDGKNIIWAITDFKSLYHFENGKWIQSQVANREPNKTFFNLLKTAISQDGSENLWAGTSKGLARFENGKWMIVYDTESGLPDNEVCSLLFTRSKEGSDIMWVGTQKGLSRLENGKWTVYDTKSGLPQNQIYKLFKTTSKDGTTTVWAASLGSLSRMENERWITYNASTGFPPGFVSSYLETTSPSGERMLWIGTHGYGVSILDLDSLSSKFINLNDSTSPALPNNVIYGILEDAQKRVYLSTNKGIARLTRPDQAFKDPSKYSIFTFTTDDGLPSNECNGNAAMIDGKGRIWIGTLGGAVIFDPSTEVKDTVEKPLYIERAWLKGRDSKQSNLIEGLLSGSKPQFAYNENHISFEFSLLSYNRESDSSYRTQLVGIDEKPSEWTADFKKEYTTLPAGNYLFRVWGKDYSGNVTGPKEFPFKINPAPWHSWWAYLLYLITVSGLGYGMVRLRLQALRHRNEILEGKVARRTEQLAEKVELLKVSEKRALEASRAKSAFLANMSHELRTPLNAILGFVQLMDRDQSRSQEDRENLSIIMRSGEHLLSLINEVLSVSKIETGQLTLNEEAFDLHRMVQGLDDMFRMRAQSKAIDLIFDLPLDLPKYVWGDEGKLRQVLINLLGNAVKFTDAGKVTLKMKWRDGMAEFNVEDTGYGIAREEMEKVFEAFAQTSSGQRSKEGTGLGLTISRNFVRLMNGDVRVDSELGKGSIFSFQIKLPLSSCPDSQQEKRRVVGLEPGQHKYRILVADDKWENRALLVRVLSSIGFEVREAANGKEALDTRISWNPDLIWMDMRMPVMDGYVATKKIRSYETEIIQSEASNLSAFNSEHQNNNTHVFIIALTASAFEHDRNAILAAGCDGFVTKPFKESTIFEKLAEHLKVRFVYEAEKRTEDVPARKEAGVTADKLAALPQEWIAKLYQAVTEGDTEAAYQVIDRVREQDEPLSSELRSLVKSYRFDEIQDLVERVC